MKALAEYLVDRGWRITGCDGDPDPGVVRSLKRSGIDVLVGHAAGHVDNSPQETPDVLIYSPAVHPENVERQRAFQLRIPQLSYVDVLSQLTLARDTVAIAGTHGKSTTTAMLGQILQTAHRSASVLCGAESISSGRNGWAGNGQHVIVEACEFRRHFLDLHPRVGCILGIEPDHFDCYPTLADAERAYREFAANVFRNQSHVAASAGVLVLRSDCNATSRAIAPVAGNRITFSLDDPTADWQAIHRHISSSGIHFQLQHRQQVSREITLTVPGLHNVQNGLAAAACAGALGLSLTEIAEGLNAYRGLKRRFEVCGTWQGAFVVDDYAHHPTEILATLTTARQIYPQRKLICLFQPHQLSRTAALLDEFAAALSLADRVYLLPVYAARENAGEQQAELSQKLIQRMTPPGTFISALDRVWRTVQTDANTDAVILTLGAGNLSRIHYDDIP